ncbi:MAG TPA: NUDIX domain-containing protein [Acidimicrobiales bacterium]|nr:NUDIX domain-containing protein [Acidimicrobiales bacterium]
MAISPHVERLRQLVGHELLVLPSAGVIPRDHDGRILLVRLIDTDQWAVIGGAVEPDESPQEAAVREAEEEAGVRVALGPVLGVVGGPEFRITYPNGDQTSYVSTVFDATVIGGSPRPDGDETSAVRWWPGDRLPYDEMSGFTRALLDAVGVAPHVSEIP